MDDPTPFGTPFATALHDRVRDEHPDLDRLVRDSVSRGTRLRRRRHTGAALAAVASVAAIALGSSLLDGTGTRATIGVTSDPAGSRSGDGRTLSDLAEDGDGEDLQTLEELAEELQQRARARTRATAMLEEGAPVYAAAPGWRCDKPMDEKFICSHGDASVLVTWRSAASWDDYQDPGKAGEQTFVSDVHGDLFATVVPGPGASRAEVVEVGEALVWAQ